MCGILGNMKFCSRGNHNVELSGFSTSSRHKDGLQAWCKECNSTYAKDRYTNGDRERIDRNRENSIARGREYVWQVLLQSVCIDCGNKDPRVLDFDHLDPSLKKKNVVELFGLSTATIQKEIDKCVVRCANCHRIRTSEQFGWWRSIRFDKVE